MRIPDVVGVGLSICFLFVFERILIEKNLTGMKRGYKMIFALREINVEREKKWIFGIVHSLIISH